MNHSPEPWEADTRHLTDSHDDPGLEIRSHDGTLLAFAASHHYSAGVDTEENVVANAERIVACVNFCRGIPYKTLTDFASLPNDVPAKQWALESLCREALKEVYTKEKP